MSERVNDEKARVVERIKKLLRMAALDSGATPNEMATAARQAQALMKKYNLEQSDAIFKELKDKANQKMVWVRATTRKNAPRKNDDTPLWAQLMAGPCADLFDCQGNMRKVGLRQGLCSVVAFYGHEMDVTVCAWTYEYLLDCVRRLGREYELKAEALAAAGKSKSNREALDSFRIGAAQAISHKLQELVEQKRRDARAHSASTALVVSKQAATQEAFPDQQFGREEADLKKNAIAMMHGQIAGMKVNVNPGRPLENKG